MQISFGCTCLFYSDLKSKKPGHIFEQQSLLSILNIFKTFFWKIFSILELDHLLAIFSCLKMIQFYLQYPNHSLLSTESDDPKRPSNLYHYGLKSSLKEKSYQFFTFIFSKVLYRVSHSKHLYFNLLWWIVICKLDLVWRWFGNSKQWIFYL